MKLLLTNFLLFISFGLFAQNVNISGKVTNDQGEALIGATLQAKGTTIGSTTDIDGNFSLSVPDEITTLVVTYTGYKDLEVNITGLSTIDIVLEEGLVLDEVVVIGYGTQKKSDLTGAISSVSGEGLDKFQSGNATQALMGRMAGVRIESNGGGPGASANIVVRGVSSLTTSNPLFVIDGMFTDNMDFLNPSDIKSIQVLKDASAAAIYGSRAANGVVIITTNDGKGTGSLKVDIESSFGTQQLIKGLDWASGSEFADLRNALADANAAERLPGFNEELDRSVNTIIEDIAISDAPVRNLSAKVYGSSGDVSYNISGNWLDQEGIIIASNFDRKTFRANTTIDKDRLTIRQTFTATRTKYRPNTIWNLNGNILPTIPFRNPDNDGGFGGASIALHGSDGNNHVGRSLLWDRHITNDNLLGSVNLSYELLEGLTANVNTGLTYRNSQNYTFWPTYFISEQIGANRPDAEVRDFRGLFTRTLVEGTLNYNKSFSDHNFDLLVGGTQQKSVNKQSGIIASGFPSNDIREVSAASTIVTANGTTIVSTLRSAFGRVNYNYAGKYFLSATIRRDGSSRFSKENRYGVFPSLAVAWTVSNEGFLKDNEVIDNLKFRGSYGELGSQNIIDYAYIPILNINSDYVLGTGQTRSPGVSQTVFSNPNLVWETTKTFNVGLDLALFDYKFTLTADYFNKKSEDILVSLQIPPTSGTNIPVAQNAATIENSGLELLANYNHSIGDFNFNLSSNITFLNNEVLSLGDNIAPIEGGELIQTRSTLTDVGHQIASFYGYQVLGIYQSEEEIASDGAMADPNAQPGDFRYADINGDGVLTADDQTILGSYIPDFEYGFAFDATFKNFDLNLIFNGVSGVEIWNFGRNFQLLSLGSNVTKDALNYWRPDNTDTDIPRLGGGANNNRASSFYVEDGSYFRLRNMQIGYSLPENVVNKANLRKVRIYGSIQNLFTITDYSGYYPEIGRNIDDEERVFANTNTLFYAGVDQSSNPTPRTFIFGIQLGF